MIASSFLNTLNSAIPPAFNSLFQLELNGNSVNLSGASGTRPDGVIGIRGTVSVTPNTASITVNGDEATDGTTILVGFGSASSTAGVCQNSHQTALSDIQRGLLGDRFTCQALGGVSALFTGEYLIEPSAYSSTVPTQLIPAAFLAQWNPGFSITGSPGSYTTDFDIDTLKPTGNPIYYVAPGATGTGASEADPGSLATALTGGVAREIILAPGDYAGEWTTNDAVDLSLTAPNGRAVISTLSTSHTWVNNGNNVWRSDGSTGTISMAVDTSVINEYGDYRTFTPRATLTEVEANPGSYIITGTDIYLHTYTSSQPGSEIRIYNDPGSSCNIDARGPNTVFFDNVHFEACNVQSVTNNAASVVAFKGSSVKYTSITGEGAFYTAGGAGDIYLKDTQASSSIEDGFDWHGGVNVFEHETRAYLNGIYDTGTGTHNGSTNHDGVNLIRLNGDYRDNQDRQVHDIATSYSVSIGCTAGNSRATDGADNNAAFAFGRDTVVDATVGYLIGCTSTGGVSTGLQVYDGATVTANDILIPNQFIEGTLN